MPERAQRRRERMDLIDKARFEALRRAKAKQYRNEIAAREKICPTVCYNDGGCDWGLAFSQ